jgi:hypothetical protein
MTAGPPETPDSDRRRRRATCLADALRYQLDSCREDEGLAAIVVSDELGCCVAYSGAAEIRELAAHLPMLARQSWQSYDELPLGLEESLVVTTFSIPGAKLHACAIVRGAPIVGSGAILERVASGFSRLLAQ